MNGPLFSFYTREAFVIVSAILLAWRLHIFSIEMKLLYMSLWKVSVVHFFTTAYFWEGLHVRKEE